MRSDTQHFGPAPGPSLVQRVWVTNSVLSATGGLVTPAWSWVSSASEHRAVQGLVRSLFTCVLGRSSLGLGLLCRWDF